MGDTRRLFGSTQILIPICRKGFLWFHGYHGFNTDGHGYHGFNTDGHGYHGFNTDGHGFFLIMTTLFCVARELFPTCHLPRQGFRMDRINPTQNAFCPARGFVWIEIKPTQNAICPGRGILWVDSRLWPQKIKPTQKAICPGRGYVWIEITPTPKLSPERIEYS